MATASKKQTKDSKPLVKPIAKPPRKPVAAKTQEQTYSMPKEVEEWIERAHSTIQHLKGEVSRLKEENENLKTYKRFAETRLTRSDHA